MIGLFDMYKHAAYAAMQGHTSRDFYRYPLKKKFYLDNMNSIPCTFLQVTSSTMSCLGAIFIPNNHNREII